jgi:collagen type VI alpha
MKVVSLLLALCLGVVSAQQKDCGAQADIVFVVDASGSVQASNFQITLQFLQSVVNSFTIGPNDVLVGVVKYDNNAYVEFPLNRHTNKAALLNAIKNIRYTSGGTATGKAITQMVGEFVPSKGDRPKVINLGIVVTDGNSGDNVKSAAQTAKAKGITMFAIGVGPNINQQQLVDIASPGNVFNAKNFQGLSQIRAALTKKACAVATKPPTPKPTPKPTPPPTPPPTTPKQCGKADIVFVVDASGSVQSANFAKTKTFMANLAKGFKIGPQDVQIGIVKYDTKNVVEFNMKKHSNVNSMLTDIQNIKYTGGGTQTGSALGVMLNQFSPSNGNRASAPDIGIVITDGNSADSVKANADLAKARGITMFAIGVGPNINQQQLKEMASGPNFVLNVQNFNDLSKIRGQLSQQACEVITRGPPVTRPPPTTPCLKEEADIVFALDSSGSIGLNDYNSLKKFVSDVSGTLNIGSNNIRVGLLRFSDKVTNSFHLNQYNNKNAVQAAIQGLKYDAGGTRTHEALSFMRTNSFLPSNGARNNVPRIAIVVTDGQSAFPAATKIEADKLKKLGVTVFSIGVGPQISMQELRDMASGADKVLTVKDFKALSNIQASISKFPCFVSVPKLTAAPKPSTPTPDCVDVDPNCIGYGQDICTDYQPWAKVNCKCHCKFCKCSTSSGPCVDALTDCSEYGADVCTNPGFTIWVETNCRKFCKRC